VILSKDRVQSRMPVRVDDADVAPLDTAIEVQETEVHAQVQITDPSQLESFLDEEEQLRERIDTVEDASADFVFCQKGIDDLAQHFLAERDIYAVRRVKKSDIEHLARATGGTVVSDLFDLGAADLDTAGTVEERTVGDDTVTLVTGFPTRERSACWCAAAPST
jgi:chaperonin GroEL (HSP60 family)